MKFCIVQFESIKLLFYFSKPLFPFLYISQLFREKLFRSMADRLSFDGWAAAGYNYVSLDDCWMLRDRDPKTQRLVADPSRFPSGIKSLADYVRAYFYS